VRGIFNCGDTTGGTAIACGGGGVALPDSAADFSEGVGVFSGFGVSVSLVLAFAFADFLLSNDTFFFCDFFFAGFGFGVGLADFFDFFEAGVGPGVSLGFGFGVAFSSSPDSFANFNL